jgi:hypothetical protein
LIGFHFFRRRVNWMIWDMLRRRKKQGPHGGAVRWPHGPELGLPGWESRQAALMQGRNPYAVPEGSQLCPNDELRARTAPEMGLPGWESRQAALIQGRNPYAVPEGSQLSPKDALNARAAERRHPTKRSSFARGSSSEGGGTEATLGETRSSGRKFRPLFWIAVIASAAATTGAAVWAFWPARN